MEKQRNITKYKSCRRLLDKVFIIGNIFSNHAINRAFSLSAFAILFFSISSHPLFAQDISLSEINALRITPTEDQNLFTKTDLKFEVIIPKIKANQIQLISTNQKSDICFKTMRKSENYQKDDVGKTLPNSTILELWYNFEKPGTYRLSPIQVSINGRKRSLQFSQFTVTDDPSKQLPRIVIMFENENTIYSDAGLYTSPIFSSSVGKKINLTVYLQYSNQLMNFSYEIPKDAIFSKTQSYEINEVRYREKKISHDLIPVASFEWTSLAKGEHNLPRIKITATSYTGSRHDLIMSEIPVFFIKDDITSHSTKTELFFDSAFTEIPVSNVRNEPLQITDEICQELADLYSKERNKLFTQKRIKNQRKKYEQEYNISVKHNREYSLNLLIGSLFILIGGLILLILSIQKKRPWRIVIFVTVMTVSLVSLIYSFVKRFELQGICTGCTIYSIPEENAEAKAEMSAGSKVRITEKTGEWYYIELGETGGWCHCDKIIVIR